MTTDSTESKSVWQPLPAKLNAGLQALMNELAARAALEFGSDEPIVVTVLKGNVTRARVTCRIAMGGGSGGGAAGGATVSDGASWTRLPDGTVIGGGGGSDSHRVSTGGGGGAGGR
jgi:hypothetical protein